ncbi:hypothetical protein ACV07N_07685 [Roseivirga echinicomitans]
MDTPYRNEALLADILKVAKKETFLCVAKDISGASEHIVSKSVGKWKASDIDMKKTPAIFLLYSN